MNLTLHVQENSRHIAELIGHGKETDRRIAELRRETDLRGMETDARLRETDARLNSLISVVERYFSNGKNKLG